jgi:hypothetical protein
MLKLRGALPIVSFLVLASLFGIQPTGADTLPPLANLAPGTDLRIQQNVDVNVVLIGFGARADAATVLAELQTLPPFNGVPKANGQGQTFLGQRFDFRYNVIASPTWFDDLLFPLLRQFAFPQPPIPIFQGLPPLPITPAQAIYNYCNLDPAFDPTLGCSFDPAAPRVNKRMITQNYLLDAASVEKVLSQSLPPLLGVDVTKPTVVVLNWWGRPDYIDHIYLDGSEPDPETGAPRGFFVVNELGGYGGTSPTDPETCHGDCIFHRLWFYDFSAGPMLRTGGFDLVASKPRFIVTPDFNEPRPSYRFHHTADYGTVTGAYRPLDNLAEDVTALAGFTYVSQIAYAGPLYSPGLTPPTLPHRLVLDINRWNWSGQSFAGLLDVPRMISKMSALPYEIAVEIAEQPESPDSNIGRVWNCSLTSGTGNDLGQSCFGNRGGGYAFGDIVTYFTNHQNQYLTGARDYEVPIFQFNVPPALQQSWIGIAFSNYTFVPVTPVLLPADVQNFVFTSMTPSLNAFNGHGQILEHEVGHQLGFSHPFQGYLCITDACGMGEFYPFGDNASTWFAESGVYVTGLMTYVRINNDYSRFELDNIQRWLTWEYLDVSNFIVAQIAKSPHSGSVAAALAQADALAGVALAKYQNYDYEGAEQQARAAYQGLVVAAAQINVQLSPSAYQAVRRNPADFNQALRDWIAARVGDDVGKMSGTLSSDGVRGLETHPLLQPTTRQLTDRLLRGARTSLR